jgi:diguanylate cyclase (GGDEF)-like protein
LKKNLTETKTLHLHPGLVPDEISGEARTLATSAQIWKSRISWRITLTVFTLILLVQGGILYSSIQNFEIRRLTELRTLTHAVIMQHLVKSAPGSIKKAPLDRAAAERIFSTSPVRGLTVYDLDYNMLSLYGEAATLQPQALPRGQYFHRSADLSRYEVIYRSSDIESPYNIVATIDASQIQPSLVDYIQNEITVFILMSGLITSILMLALGQWLLKPVLTLRRNLLNASRNPRNPEIQGTGQEGRDEIGVTLRIANSLIRKNAANIEQMERQTEEKIHRLAYYDMLTGLPNRTLFMERLEETIRRKVKGEGKRLTTFIIDIDHFRELNNTMGHEIGDRLLEAVGRRLSHAVSGDSVTARLSADQFSVMTVLDYADENGAASLEHIIKALAEPVNILQEEFKIRVSVGAATCPEDGMDARHILKNAGIALNRAKADGRDTVRYYSDDLDFVAHKRFQLLSDLREALGNGQLRLHFQPQFNMAAGEIVGAEALLRWECPDNSAEGSHIVSPEEFMPIAEQTGLIVPIGEFVLRSACQTNKSWQDKGVPPIRVAVNISAVQFHHGDLVKTVSHVLRETGMEARYLELEVRESVFMEDMVASGDILRQLHELGVRLAIDDFGTGYSSFSSLRLFPVDRLKIDPSFVRNALMSTEDAAIIKTIITLGHSLGINVMAEGVETSYHALFLKKEGCDEAQGFKYSQPLSPDKFFEYVGKYNRELVKSNLYVVGEKAS